MIIVRDVFHLQFGKAKEAVALWKQAISIMNASGHGHYRLMTDLVGRYYTVVLEGTHESMASYLDSMSNMGVDKIRDLYNQIMPLILDGYRDIWTLVE